MSPPAHTLVMPLRALRNAPTLVAAAAVAIFGGPGRAQRAPQRAATANETITLGTAVTPLTGPWAFHTGDDPRWAAPDFDDVGWERVSLTAPPGAHDDDVGLSSYVSGWTAHGHAGYAGFAWYRLVVRVVLPASDTLVLAGSPAVDDAYQVFVNGHLLGTMGNFAASPPVAHSIRPTLFVVPVDARPGDAQDSVDLSIAFRVWMSRYSLGGGVGVGGIHIAPQLGLAAGARAVHAQQWLQTVKGYVVEVAEASAFVLLAAMLAVLVALRRAPLSLLWIVAGLLFTATVRANQAFFFWTPYESVPTFDVVIGVFVIPLGLGAWTIGWHRWYRPARARFVPAIVAIATIAYVLATLVTRPWFGFDLPGAAHSVCAYAISAARLTLLGVTGYVAYQGIRARGRAAWALLPSTLCMSIGLFAREVSTLGIPGIWFPFGTGVSRTQYAYLVFDAAMLGVLLLAFPDRRAGEPAPTGTRGDVY